MWRTEGYSAVGAAHKHHVGCASSGRQHARQHVNIVVRHTAGTVHCQKQLPRKPSGIDCAAENQVAAHVNWSYLIECGCLVSKLRVARSDAIERAEPFTPNKEISIRVDIQCSNCGPVVGPLGIAIGGCQVTPPSVER